MEVKYHMKQDQVGVALCKASVRTCPNGQYGHWASEAEVWAAYEAAQEAGQDGQSKTFATTSKSPGASFKKLMVKKLAKEASEDRRLALALIREDPHSPLGYRAVPVAAQDLLERFAQEDNALAREAAAEKLTSPEALEDLISQESSLDVLEALGKNPHLSNKLMAKAKARIAQVARDQEEEALYATLLQKHRKRLWAEAEGEPGEDQEQVTLGKLASPEASSSSLGGRTWPEEGKPGERLKPPVRPGEEAKKPQAKQDFGRPGQEASQEAVPQEQVRAPQEAASPGASIYGKRSLALLKEQLPRLKEVQGSWEASLDKANRSLRQAGFGQATGLKRFMDGGAGNVASKYEFTGFPVDRPGFKEAFEKEFMSPFRRAGLAYEVTVEASQVLVTFFTLEEREAYLSEVGYQGSLSWG